jgi:hypothetical protein
MGKKKKDSLLDEELSKFLDEVVDEVTNTVKSIFGKTTDVVVKKGSRSINTFIDEGVESLKKKIKGTPPRRRINVKKEKDNE